MHISLPYDLFSLRLVCHQWYAVITNERFLKLYFRKRLGPYTAQKIEWLDLQWA